jgi:HSP20 family protein
MKLIKRSDDWGLPSVFEDFFGKDLFNLPSVVAAGTSVPAVNILESDNDFQVEVAAPGMNKKDFKIDLDNNVLTISSEKEEKKEEKDKKGNYTKKEFSYTSFERSFTLPDSIDQDKIAASYKDGVLRITLPKREEAKVKPAKTISIS